jgi:TatD DNase family protein
VFIDIHRHSADFGTANQVVRNLFHNQSGEMESGRLFSIGLHPWHVAAESLFMDLEMVKSTSVYPQIIAIGETGLDKKITTPIELQLEAFKTQIEIAGDLNKPMIIHCVRAYNEVCDLKIKSGHQKPWVIHWFNASREMSQQLIDKGFYLSFGHMLFDESSKAFKAFPFIPIENIFFETDDAGYSIAEIYRRASQLLSIKPKDLELKIENNFKNFFGINP